MLSLVGSEMCIRDSLGGGSIHRLVWTMAIKP
jgi:hypothetical protein